MSWRLLGSVCLAGGAVSLNLYLSTLLTQYGGHLEEIDVRSLVALLIKPSAAVMTGWETVRFRRADLGQGGVDKGAAMCHAMSDTWRYVSVVRYCSDERGESPWRCVG